MISTEPMETIHLYVVREEEKRPYAIFPLFCALLCLVSIVVVTLYSAQYPPYEHERLTVPATFLPLKVFTAQVPIIPTGVKTYPATYAHGYLTFSNGSVIGQSVPAGFTVDGAMTDRALYVPPATADGFGSATVSAHLLASGINVPTLSINEVIGSSLFIRNLSAFTGGHPAYSVTIQLPKDIEAAINTAKAFVAAQRSQIQAFLARPCDETTLVLKALIRLAVSCRFAVYSVPSYMHITAVKLSGKNFLVDVAFIPHPVIERIR
ncbi:MAG: hypothetical protein ACYDER_28575 [Ktedonobacteraceae bacterium]